MSELPIIHSRILQAYPSVLFGLSTRRGGVSPEPYGLNLSFNVGDEPSRVEENRRLFFQKLQIGLNELAVPGQCHGDTVRRAVAPGTYEKCDALVTDKERIFLCVSVADCIPLFMHDRLKNVVAAVHVGWRGAVSGIIFQTLSVLQTEFGAQPEDLVAFFGPSARSCCYEVGVDVASKFAGEFLEAKNPGRFFLDLPGFARAKLSDAGVSHEMIEDDGRCTICSSDLFHSYRRDGARSGRMVGVIGLRF